MNAPDPAEVVRLRNRVAALERHNAELWACLKAEPRSREQIEQIQTERDTMPKDERIRHEAADAPLLRIQLAHFVGDNARLKGERDRYRLAWQSARERAKSAWRNAADWHEEATLLDTAVAHVRDVVYALPALPDPNNPEILFRVGQHDMAGRVKGAMGWPEKPEARS